MHYDQRGRYDVLFLFSTIVRSVIFFLSTPNSALVSQPVCKLGAACIYRLVIISIDLSKTAHFGHCLRGRNCNPVVTLPHTAVVFRVQPFNVVMFPETWNCDKDLHVG